MKLFSFKNLLNNLKETMHRFPVVSSFAILGTFIGLVLIEMEFPPNADYTYLYNLLITSVLGFLMFISVRLIIEREKMKFTKRAIFEGIAVLFLIGYFFLLPQNWETAFGADFIRIFLLSLAFFFSVTFAPFIGKDQANGFWQHNKVLFIRMFFAGAYGITLFIGLALALTAIDQLLGFDVPGELYGEVWVVIMGILVSHFFLSGIPQDYKKLEKTKDYPKGIKFFAQFILIPLIAIYALILGTYIGQIAVSGEWPEGTVSWLILLFSIVGVISHVLLYPLQKDSEYVWVKYFSKVFFALEIPFIAVLFMAIGIRLNEYGLTEARYYVVALGVWFTFMAIYFLMSKKQNLKLIPMTLFAFILFSSFGPWGAIAMSENNQISRLENILIEQEVLVHQKIVKVDEDKKLEKKELREISGVLDYLGSVHGYAKIDFWFEENLEEYLQSQKEKRQEYTKNNEPQCWQDACYIMELMGLKYLNQWEYREPDSDRPEYLNFHTTQSNVQNVEGYDLYLSAYVSSYETNKREIDYNDDIYQLRFSEKETALELKFGEEIIAYFPVQDLFHTLETEYLGTYNDPIPAEVMTLVSTDKKEKIILKNLGLKKEKGVIDFESLDAIVLIKR